MSESKDSLKSISLLMKIFVAVMINLMLFTGAAFAAVEDFITEWTIPADADGTGAGTTIKLPIPTYSTNNYTVDWGDGTSNTYTTAAFPTHTYTNTAEATYTITIRGSVNRFGYNNIGTPTVTNSYSNYYTYTQYLTKLVQWGELGATQYGFANCENLIGEIPEPTVNSFANVTSFYYTFYSCSGLTGSIPAELFANCPNVTTFGSTFNCCSGLTGEIPAELFANCPNVTDFSWTFNNCSKLTGEIPAELFANCPNVTTFGSTFNGCSGLTGEIPAELFANCPKVTTFYGTFNSCSGLTGSIPAELFANCPKVTTFYYTFASCSGLTGEIPAELFANCPNVTDFSWTFYRCSGLTGEIPAELFSSNTAITTIPDKFNGYNSYDAFKRTFYNCSNITSVDINTLYIGYNMFYGCNKLVDITMGDNVQAIGTDAFQATSPYSATNLLKTDLSTTNTVAMNYDWESDYRQIDNTLFFTTEWTVPAGATIKLPISAYSTNNFTVDWGDGTAESYTTAAFPSHTYTNTAETTYTIKITGSVNRFGYNNVVEPSEENEYSDYYTFTQYLTKIVQWGETSTEQYGFAYCENLAGEIPSPTENTFANVTSFRNMFMNCTSLSGTIPDDLFTYATKATDFTRTFYNCSSLTSGLSANLFAENTLATDYTSTFEGCSNLSGSIPGNMFDKNTAVTSFANTFGGCTKLSGSIPENLFANNENVESFSGTFRDCTGLSGSIPANLFATNKEVTSFNSTFDGCVGLTAVPAGLFTNNNKVVDFAQTFKDCTQIGSIPAYLFETNTLATTFQGTFQGCTGLTGTIPASLFLSNTFATNFIQTFSGCTGLEGEISAILFAGNTAVNVIPSEFTVDSMDDAFRFTFANCSNLTSANIDTLYIGYNMFYGCNKLVDITIGDNVKAIASNAFQAVDPYNADNLLGTNLFSDNELALEFNWKSNYRKIANNISDAIITLSPETFVYDGTAKEPTVTVVLDEKTLIQGTEYTVTYEDNINVGTAKAIITGVGKYEGEVIKEFTITEAPLTVTSSGYSGTYDGVAHGITVICEDATVTYGTVEGAYGLTESPTYTNAGTYTVYFKVERENYATYEGSETVVIEKRQVVIEWGNTSFTFNGALQVPTATVESGVANETILLEVTGAAINAGAYTATAVVSGVSGGMQNVNNYIVSNTTADFIIIPNADAQFEVTPLQSTFVYDGTFHTPDVVVKADGVELVKGKDYNISYTNNKNVGAAGIYVSGIGNYAGAYGSAGFEITKRPLTIIPNSGQSKPYATLDPVLTYTYTGNVVGETPKFTGALSRDTGEDVGDYIIRIGSLAIVDNGTFLEKNYELKLSDSPIVFSIVITDISNAGFAVNPTIYYYDGTPKTPATTLIVNGITLTRNIDYTVEYENNINVGTATARATGIGNYKGVLEATFTILPKSISDGTLTLNPTTFVYDGTSKTPDTTVVVDGVTLVRDKDYKVSYHNNIEIGDNTAIAIATGIGNYSGELQATFSIVGGELKGQVSLSQYEYIYDSTEKRPTVTFVLETGEELIEGEDFEVEYINNIDVGTATAIIRGIGVITGEVTEEFEILPAELTLELKDKYAMYTGNSIAIDPVTIVGAYEDLSANVVYSYYASIFSETPMEALPVDIGIYYVEATIAGLSNYQDAISNRAKLTIYGAPTTPKIATIDITGENIAAGGITKEDTEAVVYGSKVENALSSVEIGYKYSLDGTTWEEYTERLLFTEEGTHTIYAKAYLKENPELESGVKVHTFTIYRSNPVIEDIIVPDITDTVVIDVEVIGENIDEVWITEDPEDNPTKDEPSDNWMKNGEDDKTPIFELTQGDEIKTIYVWVRDPAGNIAGPVEKQIILSALKIGNETLNKTTIKFKVTDLYLHTSEINVDDMVIYVNDTISKGEITSLTRTKIENGYEYIGIMENVNGDGPVSIGLNGGNVFDRAGNYLSPTTKVPTNEITADNTLPIVNTAVYDNVLYITASDLHMKAIIVNGEILGTTNGEYQYDLRVGINKLVVIDEYGNDIEQEFFVEERVAELSVPNNPEIQSGMQAIYWENGVEIVEDDFIRGRNYDYTKPSEAVENVDSKWANAKTEDGSYWVWIPRYAYKETYYIDSNKTIVSEIPTDYVDYSILFLYETSSEEYLNEYDEICPLPVDYKVANAFTDNTARGGWNAEIRGFWISKYELSAEDSEDNINWVATKYVLGGANQFTTLAGNKEDLLRAVSKPDMPAWRGISASSAYMNAYYMQRDFDSHLIKNSEWEATYILALSEYGRNGNFIELDTNANTGGDESTSSTGNITGVFDLLGGVWEYTSTYIPDDSLEKYGEHLTNDYLAGYDSDAQATLKERYRQGITTAKLSQLVLSDVERTVFDETILENAYNTSLVIYRGGSSESNILDVESVPVAGSPDERVGYRAVMISEQ